MSVLQKELSIYFETQGDISLEEIGNCFRQFGIISRIQLLDRNQSHLSFTYGFCEFLDPKSKENAFAAVNSGFIAYQDKYISIQDLNVNPQTVGDTGSTNTEIDQHQIDIIKQIYELYQQNPATAYLLLKTKPKQLNKLLKMQTKLGMIKNSLPGLENFF